MVLNRLLFRISFILVFFWFGLSAKGQTLDVDSAQIAKVSPEAEYVHSPKKAATYSAILPGLGQAYNKKYWKIPLVYIGFGTIGYFIGWNNKNYKVMKLAYKDLNDDDENTNSFLKIKPPNYNISDKTQRENFSRNINRQQNYYRRNRDLLIISIVGFYGMNIIDASVDAHLFDFDMSEDLSFNWQPTMQNFNSETIYGINCTFTF